MEAETEKSGEDQSVRGNMLVDRWRSGMLPAGLSVPLTVLSWGYAAALAARRGLCQVGVLQSRSLPSPVISVGNLTVGGTGKTPFSLWLAEALGRRGKKVVILTRGYGSRGAAGREPFRAQDVSGNLASIAQIGDERLLLARRLPHVPVVVDKNRYRGGIWARKEWGVDFFILDDGFQHLALRRRLDLVLVDGLNPFGNGCLFPRGILREPIGALRRAHGILVTRANLSDRLPQLRSSLKSLCPEVPLFEVDYTADALLEIGGGPAHPLESMRESPVLAFSGLADPASFLALLKNLGANLVGHRDFGDHHWYTTGEIEALEIEARARGARYLITTEKDGVRIEGLKRHWDPRCIVLRLGLRLRSEKEFWALVDRRTRIS